VLRSIFEPVIEAITEVWVKLHNEELHNLYCLPNIIMAVKSSRM
jgi:hypothetical protein